jgi:malate/lactate dehydrogenase
VRSIVILGAGELGGALARQLAAADIARHIVLVDESATVAEGKALDIRQAAPVDGYSAHLAGTSDESIVVGADAIVVADRFSTGQEWSDDPGGALIRKVAHLNTSAIVLCAGARQIDLVEHGVREGGINRRRLLGSAPEALRSAVLSLTALEAKCTPMEISLTVVGKPPAQIIVPWEDASIGGLRATDVLSPPAITRLDGRLARLWPPGPLTLASAATEVLRAAATRSFQMFSVFVASGARVGMLPARMTTSGLAEIISPTLNARDKVRLETALQR